MFKNYMVNPLLPTLHFKVTWPSAQLGLQQNAGKAAGLRGFYVTCWRAPCFVPHSHWRTLKPTHLQSIFSLRPRFYWFCCRPLSSCWCWHKCQPSCRVLDIQFIALYKWATKMLHICCGNVCSWSANLWHCKLAEHLVLLHVNHTM